MDRRLGTIFYYPQHDNASNIVELGCELSGGPFNHVFSTETYSDAFTPLAALSQVMDGDITFGTSIANVYLRDPYAMAMLATGVAGLVDGRFVLGIGTGHQEVNSSGLGLDMARPFSRMRDYLEVVQACLGAHDGPVDVANGRYRVTGLPLAWNVPVGQRVPVVLGALGDRMMTLGTDTADGVSLSLSTTPRIRRIRQGAIERTGRAPLILAVVNTVVARDRATARRQIEPFVSRYLRFPFYRHMFHEAGLEFTTTRLSDEAVDAVSIAGPPEYVRERVAEYREAGVDVPLMSPAQVLDPLGADPIASYVKLAEVFT